MVDRKRRKWIDHAIADLDPKNDYAQIMRLSVIYRSNDPFMDLIYSITFPNFVVPNRGAIAILREGKGKVVRHGAQRMDDTARHILIWNEFGPEHEYTRRSINALNKIHKHWSERYPGSFGHNEDYIYTLSYEATLFHRLMRRVGLSGLSEKQQQASWEFYSRLSRQFRNAETDELLTDFPENFTDCLAFVDEYEAAERPRNIHAVGIDEALIQAFAKRHMPPRLRSFGRMLILSLLPEATVQGLGLKLPSPIMRGFCRRGLALYLLIGLKLLPDPVKSHPEIIRERDGQSIESYVAAVTGPLRPGADAPAGI